MPQESADLPEHVTIRPRAWAWGVFVLALCHAAAVATFQILNILVEPIKRALDVTDVQYSLMQGLAVAIFASLLGVPAARLADRGNRRSVILIGVVTWSAATFACAMAQSASELVIARMFVGLGEAFLYPAALSLIADVAPPQQLSTAIGVFGCGGPVGTGLALTGGGWLMQRAGWLTWAAWLPSDAWRIAFFLCGVFGTIAAALLLTVSEPARRSALQAPQGSLGGTLSHLRRNWKVFCGVSSAMLALSYCVFATSSWSPTMLVRVHGMGYAGVASVTGLGAFGGAVGAWIAGTLTDRLESAGRRDASLEVAIAVAALIFATTAAAVLCPSVQGASVFVALAYSLLGVPTVLGGTALQQISPPAIRAQVMAIQVVLVNLVALSLAPLTVATFTEYVFRRPEWVGQSLIATNALGAVVTFGAVLASRRRFTRMRN
jgi:MFS family permease